MKLGHRSLLRFTMPLKALVDRFAFAILIVCSVALLILAKANQDLMGAVTTRVADAFVPVLAVLTEPIAASRRLAEATGRWVALHEENARLREQNDRLLEWQRTARHLALENEALRRMLDLAATTAVPTAVTARVVADAGGAFVHTVLVDAGAAHGVVEGMAAVDQRGLVGRVIDVGEHSARVLLLIDLNSRVPVMVEPSRDQAILAGDNTHQPGLTFLPVNPHLSVGDRVVTSGRGGMLPPGLDVGVVSALREDKVAVSTWADWDRLEYVNLLEYAPVLPPEALAEAQREAFGPPLPPDHPWAAAGAPGVAPWVGQHPGIPPPDGRP